MNVTVHTLFFNLIIMKKLFIAVMLLTLVSCHEPNVQTKTSTHRVGPFGKQLSVIEIEGCEYFFGDYDRGALFTHKGNCTNPLHALN